MPLATPAALATGAAAVVLQKLPEKRRVSFDPSSRCIVVLSYLPKMGSVKSLPTLSSSSSSCEKKNIVTRAQSTSKTKKDAEKEQALLQKLKQDRREGRALLRRMVVKSDDVDWPAVIAKADSLHQKQLEKLKQQEQRHRKREKKRVLDQRKKADAAGSFSINLLTMRHSEEEYCDIKNNNNIISSSHRRSPFRKDRSDATRSIGSSLDLDYHTE